MNTAKILDVVPQATTAPNPAPVTPTRPEPQAVPAVGGGATADKIQQRAQRQAEAAEDERKRAAANPPQARPHNLDREVGVVEDSFQVFIDLVSPALKDRRFRIFGPSDHPGPLPPTTPTADPASARAAYTGPGALQPTVKTDV